MNNLSTIAANNRRQMSLIQDAKTVFETAKRELEQQILALEITMSECPGTTAKQQSWLSSQERKIRKMNGEIRMIDSHIAGCDLQTMWHKGHAVRVEATIAAHDREIKRTLVATIAAVEGRKVGKNPNRHYVGLGERKKTTAQDKPAKKDKKSKDQQGKKHKKGHGQQQAAA